MTVAIEQHLEVNPAIRGGRPCLAGTRITVDDIVISHVRIGQPVSEIADQHLVEPAAVHAALSYYYDHKAEVDQRIAADEAYATEFMRNNPSILREKLRALGRE